MGKVQKGGTFFECEAKLDYCLVLGPLILGMVPTIDLSPPQKFQFIFTDKHHCHRVIITPVHIEVHVYRLGFVKPYSNEMDEVILRTILLYIINNEKTYDRKIMSNLSKSSFMNTSS